jgi:hypothetical protein
VLISVDAVAVQESIAHNTIPKKAF